MPRHLRTIHPAAGGEVRIELMSDGIITATVMDGYPIHEVGTTDRSARDRLAERLERIAAELRQ